MNTFTVIHVFHPDTKNPERKLERIREELKKIADSHPTLPLKFDETFSDYTIFSTEEDLDTVRRSCSVGLTKDDILVVLPRNTESGVPYIYPHSLALTLQPQLQTLSPPYDLIQILKVIQAFLDNCKNFI